MRFIYTAISTLALPVIVFRLWWRGRRLPGYRQRIAERFGFAPPLDPGLDLPIIWVHAVSVGETIAAVPVVEFLLSRGDVQVLMSNMTPTGADRARELFGDRVLHAYAPYDIPAFVNRFLARIQPRLLLIMETELWPNTIRACRERSVPVLLLNARLSEKSAHSYSLFASLTEEILRDLTCVAAQAEDDAQRFRDLGLPAAACQVTGSIKFDLTLSQTLLNEAAALKAVWSDKGRRPIAIAASTHEGEEELVLQAFQLVKKTVPDALLILVPRHPDRFGQVARLCDATEMKWQRRSQGSAPAADIDLMLGDTMGEMLLLYGLADVAFVGGSLVPTGGHNLIEPAAWGLPLVSGTHLFNFAEVARLMLAGGGLRLVNSSEALAAELGELLSDPAQRRQRGEAAKRVADANRGALARVEALLQQYLP